MIDADPASGLTSSVLVLNRAYVAVHIIACRRAFGLLYRELAEVIFDEDGQYFNYDFIQWCELSELRHAMSLEAKLAEADDPNTHDEWVRSVRSAILVPRVIRLLTYDRVPKRSVRLTRRNIYARDQNLCQYCGEHFPLGQLSIDHVMPKSRGGKTTWENLVASCTTCNTRKGNRTPAEARMDLKKRPVKPRSSPLLADKLRSPKYAAWRTFLSSEATAVEV
jgi:5-methylcytosine-specific restriction endonuclease McrA